MEKRQIDPRGRLYEQVAARLAAEISARRYGLGERLPSERELASLLGVSRPTVREALIALEADGLVDVRMGSGVYVIAFEPSAPQASATYQAPTSQSQMGHFEVLEVRRLVEPHAAALAAQMRDDDELASLEGLLQEMTTQNAAGDMIMSEDADRRFHLGIARASKNGALLAVVEMLWEARNQSDLSRRVLDKVRASGVQPRIDEHVKVLAAIKARNAQAAHDAMLEHLDEVIEVTLQISQTQAIELALAETASQRRRFAMRARSLVPNIQPFSPSTTGPDE